MALDQSALLEMPDALRTADASDRIRQAADRRARRVDDRWWRVRPSPPLGQTNHHGHPQLPGARWADAAPAAQETRAWQRTATTPKLQFPSRISVH